MKRGRHEALRRLSRGWTVPLALVMSLIMGSVAWADNLEVDGDGLVPVTANSMNLGNICVGQTASGNALLAIRRTGGGALQNVFSNGSAATVSAGTPSSIAIAQAFVDSGISLPGNWTGAGNNTMSSDTATSMVTATAVAPTGAKNATIQYTASGTRASDGAALSRTATLTINWTVVPCDTTPPVISPNVVGTLGSNGWYTSDVDVSWTVVDAESAVTSTSGCGSSVVSADTAGVTFTCDATSAGGTNSQSVTIKRDATAPTISGSASPAANANGWNNTDVMVSFSCSDALSGVASCTSPTVLSGDGAGQSVSGGAIDLAGNSATATVSGIDIDKTAPTISGSASPAANANGWNNTDVKVSFSCDDPLSGIASCSTPTILSSDAAGQSVTGFAVDKAGNSASDTVSGINIDKTAPVVAVTGVSDGATYLLGSAPVAGCSTSDALSGVDSAATVSVSGGPTVGGFTATCSGGTDLAGNVAAATSVGYTVKYDFAGFFRPVDMGGVVNVVKAGSAIPVKFSLGGNQGLSVIAAGFPKSTTVACPGGTQDVIDASETVTAGSSSLSYDSSTGQYNYVWKTDKAWSGCRRLDVKLIDGQTYSAFFKFTK